MRVLQVCNVGQIVGGTAACAWSVTQALPGVMHRVAVLGPIDAATRAAFGTAVMQSVDRVPDDGWADVVLLHNTPPDRCGRLRTPSVLMRHSDVPHAAATRSVCCSRWLRDRLQLREPLLHQGVPRERSQRRGIGETLVVGRLCTPTARKWPGSLVAFYRGLAAACPHVRWEFVGCPDAMQPPLREACGRVVFHAAGPTARRHIGRWDALLYHHPTLPETFGRTVAEARLAGCIPIVDAAGGFLEQITPGTGFLCPTPGDFAAALQTLADPFLRRRMSLAAAADDRFTHSQFGVRLRCLLVGCAGGDRGRGPGDRAVVRESIG